MNMITDTFQPGMRAMKSRQILSLSLVVLLGVVSLAAGPAFAVHGSCVHAIDYSKLTAPELEMLYRDIEVTQFTDEAATRGICATSIDYGKLSASELENIYRDVDAPLLSYDGMSKLKPLASIDYSRLTALQLDRINQGIGFNLEYSGDTGTAKGMTAHVDR